MKRTNPEDFVRSYLTHNLDIKMVSTELGISLQTAKNTLRRLRKAGVKLPIPRKPRNLIDVAALNQLIINLRG